MSERFRMLSILYCACCFIKLIQASLAPYGTSTFGCYYCTAFSPCSFKYLPLALPIPPSPLASKASLHDLKSIDSLLCVICNEGWLYGRVCHMCVVRYRVCTKYYCGVHINKFRTMHTTL